MLFPASALFLISTLLRLSAEGGGQPAANPGADASTALRVTPEVVLVSGSHAGEEMPPPKPVSMTQPSTGSEKVDERGIPERANRAVGRVTQSTLTVYRAASIPGAAAKPAALVIICPGGGYSGLAIDKEGHDIARFLSTLGVSSAVLKYRLPTTRPAGSTALPLPVEDVRDAIKIARAHAAEWNIDPQKVGIMGFSAGGHLASTAATHDLGEGTRPNFAILGYPVISMDDDIAHKGSRRNLIGDKPSAEEMTLYSNEKQVDEKTPPVFIFHAKDDRTVPVANSERFAEACKAHQVPVEFHEFAKGGHGFGFGLPGADSAEWPGQLAAWLKSRDLAP